MAHLAPQHPNVTLPGTMSREFQSGKSPDQVPEKCENNENSQFKCSDPSSPDPTPKISLDLSHYVSKIFYLTLQF